jgi:septal ring factor EnvC (AmiA/AmiB activator)
MEAVVEKEIQEVNDEIRDLEAQAQALPTGDPERLELRKQITSLRQKEVALQQKEVALQQKEAELAKQKTLQMQGAVPPSLSLLHGLCIQPPA